MCDCSKIGGMAHRLTCVKVHAKNLRIPSVMNAAAGLLRQTSQDSQCLHAGRATAAAAAAGVAPQSQPLLEHRPAVSVSHVTCLHPVQTLRAPGRCKKAEQVPLL